MSEASTETNLRIGADESVAVTTPTEPTAEVVQADIPGEKDENYVTITLSNPLNEHDRMRLGLPLDARTEVGQKVRVNKNGASMIIGAGYATVDPEDHIAVREALVTDGQAAAIESAPVVESAPEAQVSGETFTATPAINDVTPASAEVPPQEVPIAASTPGAPTPGEGSEGEVVDTSADETTSTDGSTTKRRR